MTAHGKEQRDFFQARVQWKVASIIRFRDNQGNQGILCPFYWDILRGNLHIVYENYNSNINRNFNQACKTQLQWTGAFHFKYKILRKFIPYHEKKGYKFLLNIATTHGAGLVTKTILFQVMMCKLQRIRCLLACFTYLHQQADLWYHNASVIWVTVANLGGAEKALRCACKPKPPLEQAHVICWR